MNLEENFDDEPIVEEEPLVENIIIEKIEVIDETATTTEETIGEIEIIVVDSPIIGEILISESTTTEEIIEEQINDDELSLELSDDATQVEKIITEPIKDEPVITGEDVNIENGGENFLPEEPVIVSEDNSSEQNLEQESIEKNDNL